MSDRKPCIRCGRTIDGYARICPYCNWDQTAPVPAASSQPTVASDYKPPSEETQLRKYALGAGGAIVMVIVLFFIGAHVHGKNPPPVTATEQAQAPSGAATLQQRTNVTLIPDNGPAPPAPGQQPVTSAPVSDTAEGLANQTDRTDATAASSVEYSQMAKRAAAEASRTKVSGIVDPMSIQGNAYGNPMPRPMTSSSSSNNAVRRAELRTPPVPEYQGLPDIGVRGYASAKLLLTIGPDGRVHGVNVIQPLPGATPQLLEAVQSWRFKPATANGTPVPSTFMTSLQFKPR